ncbi:MAG TPA: hypothetical protein VGH93_11340, partial [Solirubrobacteraceae bacterium]
EKLRAMARQLAHSAAANPLQARILNQNQHQLPSALAATVLDAQRSIVRDLMRVIEDGMNRGEFRRANIHTLAMAIIGMCLWASFWVDADASEPVVDEVSGQIADLAVAGVMLPDRGSDRTSPADLFALIRADLAELEHIVDPPN